MIMMHSLKRQTTGMRNKEYGSDFHYYPSEATKTEHSIFSENHLSLFLSGRVALFNLLSFGIENYGWNKVGFPSYYCHEVVDFCRTLPIEILYYNHNPFNPIVFDWVDNENSVFINVDFFGVSKLDTSFIKKSIVIEDVTHNLLEFKSSNAIYCFGSLRKQLPVPVGGFCYDRNNNFSSNLNVNDFSEELAKQKLSAMQLKSSYLKGEFAQKEVFRKLFIEAESLFESSKTNSAIPVSVKNIFLQLPHKQLITKTRSNIKLAKSILELDDKVKMLVSNQNTEMGLVLLCETPSIRDSLKSFLINNKIYPAIIWPNQKNEADINFESKVLFVHVDFRYDTEDIHFIVKQLNNFTAHV